MSLLVLASVSLSCTHTTIEDQTWFADKGKLGAKEFHTLRDVERDVPKEEWDQIRFGMMCTTPDTFAENEANILKLCYENPRCKIEAYEQMENFFLKVREVKTERDEVLP